MKKHALLIAVAWLLAAGCSTKDRSTGQEKESYDLAGTWDARLIIEKPALKEPLPIAFQLKFDRSSGKMQVFVVNGDEEIPQEYIQLADDSIRIRSLYFDSWLDMRVSDSMLSGTWYNRYRGPDYKMPFRAQRSVAERKTRPVDYSLKRKWKVIFSPGTDDREEAIGLFRMHKNKRLTGTFMTETGDYRYLQGSMTGDSLTLSTFDGSHAYLFTASRAAGDTLKGTYYSGYHYQTGWIAWPDSTASLRDPYQLTGIENPEEPLDLTFTDLAGNPVSLSDERYAGKPVIVQLMGSWCPNCLDETRFLKKIYPSVQEKGIAVLSLAFEAADSAHAISLLRKYRQNLDLEWEILYAGSHRKSEAAKRLPRLEHVYSFPTTIYLKPDHSILAIHTGFNGPGTGEAYNTQSERMRSIIDDLARLARTR